MPKSEDSAELRATLHKRHDVLAALATEPQTKPELVDTVGPSRSTIDRSISALEETGCIERRGSDYHLTQLGRVSLAEHDRYKETMNGVARTEDVLNVLPDDTCIDPVFLNGVTIQSADPHAPESALEASITHLESTDRLVGLAPVVLSLYTDVLTTLVREHGLRTEILLHESTLDSLLEYYQDRFSAMDMSDHFDFYVTDQELPYALWIMEHDEHPLAGITVHENGGVRGVLMNDSAGAVRWARDEYAQYLDNAKRVTVDVPQ
jgi:predicted transcriptional regulator